MVQNNFQAINLKAVDGDLHDFYHQYNGISDIKYAIVAYQNDKAVGCSAIKQFDDTAMEIKRMYVLPTCRKQGVATIILSALEKWTKDLGFQRCVLETGKMQVEALELYTKCGYQVTPNYGQYIGKFIPSHVFNRRSYYLIYNLIVKRILCNYF